MGLARDGRAQNLVEGQLDAMIRVQPGAEIGQSAGRIRQSPVPPGVERPGQGFDDGIDPAEQRPGEARRNALPCAQGGAAGQQRVGGDGFFVQGLV